MALLLGASSARIAEAAGRLALSRRIGRENGYLFLSGKRRLIEKRRALEANFGANRKWIWSAAWLLSHFPFVRAVLLTGTPSKGLLGRFDDFDFLIIAERDRIWLCRLLINLLRRIVSANYRSARYRYFCCNYYLSTADLLLRDRNEFTALETTFARPLFNVPLCAEFFKTNDWVRGYFPMNAPRSPLLPTVRCRLGLIQNVLEFFLDRIWNERRENDLMGLFFRRWRGRDAVYGRAASAVRAGRHFIGVDYGARREFLLGALRGAASPECASPLRTDVMLAKCARTERAAGARADILLTHAYLIARTTVDRKVMKPYVPLGPLYVAASLRKQGHDVGFYDTTFDQDLGNFSRHIQRFRPGLVGISALETTKKTAFEMIRICKIAGSGVVVGGPDPSNDPPPYLAQGADAVVVGEGEQAVAEILEHIQYGGRPLEAIDGVYTASGPGRPRPLIREIDAVPWPARDLIDFREYFTAWKRKNGYASMHLAASRGCLFGCAWCSKPVFGASFRQRSGDDVAEEMLYLKKAYAPDRLWFNDDNFAFGRGWLEGFHRAALSKRAEMPFECLMRADMISQDALRLLKETGCMRIWYGAESGSQKILDRMKKGCTVAQVRRAVGLTRACGMQAGLFLMLGYPSESVEDVELTRGLVRETQPDRCGISVAYPIKGTAFYNEVRDTLLSRNRAPRLENDNRLAFRAAYPASFYGIARRLIARESRRESGFRRIYGRLAYGVLRGIYGVYKRRLGASGGGLGCKSARL